jgi:hypothetical protein
LGNFLAEDIRTILNKLNEYMLTVEGDSVEEPKQPTTSKEPIDQNKDDQDDSDETIDDILTTPKKDLNEYNKHFNDVVGQKAVIDALRSACEIGPTTKAIASQLVQTLKTGGGERALDDGLEGVYNAVIYTIEIATDGDRSKLLHMLDDFENRYEGDNYAFDQKEFPRLMIELKKLGREILQSASKKED